VLFAYGSYLLAEGLNLSGIVTILFHGIIVAHYAYNNLSREAQHISRELFHVISSISETLVFIFLGLAIFSYNQEYNAPLIGVMIPVVLIARALNIFPLSIVINLIRLKNSQHRISWQEQVILWFAGLRGAMAFALSLEIPSRNAATLLTTTLMIILFTVTLCGALMVPLLKLLKVKTKVRETDQHKSRLVDERQFISKNLFLRIDRRYLKPFFSRVARESIQTGMDVDVDESPQIAYKASATEVTFNNVAQDVDVNIIPLHNSTKTIHKKKKKKKRKHHSMFIPSTELPRNETLLEPLMTNQSPEQSETK